MAPRPMRRSSTYRPSRLGMPATPGCFFCCTSRAPWVRFIHSSTASARSGFACSSNAIESLYMTVARVSEGVQRRNSANAGSSRPAARKSEPRLKASCVAFRGLPASQRLSMPTPIKINAGRPVSRRTRNTYRNSISVSSSPTIVAMQMTPMLRRPRSGRNSTARMASNAGASHCRAFTQAGNNMARSVSRSATRAAASSECVTNCPEGNTADAPIRAGS